ncbi:hypothetical protein, partial [Mesorhizobium sp. M00.F.Ca.ET.216.01.1.1]|uniref:hypothetical protein n=1 Tax=Mesorhizobium sp. M00.F.Ca.ET.216.01.1.1 TaxID=2500528 RepID=UPI001AED3C10
EPRAINRRQAKHQAAPKARCKKQQIPRTNPPTFNPLTRIQSRGPLPSEEVKRSMQEFQGAM